MAYEDEKHFYELSVYKKRHDILCVLFSSSFYDENYLFIHLFSFPPNLTLLFPNKLVMLFNTFFFHSQSRKISSFALKCISVKLVTEIKVCPHTFSHTIKSINSPNKFCKILVQSLNFKIIKISGYNPLVIHLAGFS